MFVNFICFNKSCLFCDQFRGTITAPTLAIAKKRSINSKELFNNTPT